MNPQPLLALNHTRNRFFSIVGSMVSVFLLESISADVVTLMNGDRITGVVVKKEKNVLKLKTAYAGTITIQWPQVSRLEMDEAVQVKLDDESVVRASTIGGKEGGDIKQAAKEVAVTLAADQVDVIKPEPWEPGTTGKFTGRVNLAMKLESLPDQSDEVDADFSVNYRRGVNRFKMRGQLDYDKKYGETTTEDWIVIPKYDRFFSDKMYGSILYLATQERFKGLKLRQIAGPAIGYQFWEGKPTSLTSELGLVFVDEDYTSVQDNSFYGPAWQVKFEQDLFRGRVQFYHNNYFIMDGKNASKLLWRSWTGFRVPINHGIVGSLEYEIDHDSLPVLRSFKNDNTLRLKFGYEW